MSDELRLEAIVRHLNVNADEIVCNGSTFEYGSCKYLVLTEDEADKMASEYIRESLWSFNTEWILNHSKVDNNPRTFDALKSMQEKCCENCNELMYALIEDFDDFVSDSIEADGRGQFLSSYDGEENEVYVGYPERNWFYIYRIN